jgi:hypothetical protein
MMPLIYAAMHNKYDVDTPAKEVNMKNWIKNLWLKWSMSAEEKWLSESSDIVELENRLRQLETQGWRHTRRRLGCHC